MEALFMSLVKKSTLAVLVIALGAGLAGCNRDNNEGGTDSSQSQPSGTTEPPTSPSNTPPGGTDTTTPPGGTTMPPEGSGTGTTPPAGGTGGGTGTTP
jgi:hypothetical protein